MADDFAERYGDLLTGSYDCVDRVVLNAYFPLGHNPGGFRCWWRRLHGGSDDQLDDTHLMRMAGRFARRVKAWAAANGIPVIFCTAGERKHLIAEQYLEENSVSPGVFLVLAAKAPASVWKVHRSARGVITRLEKKREYVYHYCFHIMDPAFGHLTVKMSGHPPFGAQVILNGHEYVAVAAQGEGIGFTKEGNCFTEIADPQRLARVADAWPRHAAIGRLGQVCDRWIYSACLCFGLDLAEQEASGFRYAYSVYQAEYSRNLLFKSGAQMEELFDRVLDRTRSRLDIPAIRTLFGLKARPHRNRKACLLAQEIVIEKPRYGLSWFRISFGRLQLKAYTKGEHVLRFEATVHNAKELRCRRSLEYFAEIIDRLAGMADRFAAALDCADIGFLPDGVLDELPLPAQSGAGRIAGIDLNKPRIRAALSAALALAPAPAGSPPPSTPPGSARSPATTATPPGRPPTTCASSAASNSWTNLARPAATTSRQPPPAPSAPCSPSATTLLPRSSPESAAPAWDASPRSGPPPTATTRPCASACRPCSSTSASKPSQQPHRQHFVDQKMQNS